jgi:methylenetetrahydrofolate dehydrogenase (NADP+)/methenyltetrahydrofolate cyclohydrolase
MRSISIVRGRRSIPFLVTSRVACPAVTATLMDGRALAAKVRADVAREVTALGRPVGLATVLVGDDPASAIYVRRKREACAEVGIQSFHHELPATTSEDDLLALVGELNADDAVTGILVQLPLPEQVDDDRVIRAIDPIKDVDGFHPANAGFLLQGRPTLPPATPSGVMELLREYEVDLAGAEVLVIGRSNIVGKPVALLLLAEHATVTLAHSRTRDLARLAREADVVVAAVGRAETVTAGMVKPGAAVVDVGINRVDGRVVGDVAEEVREVAGLVSPVPGGVGPMTIAMLLRNTVRAARYQERALAFPLA